MSRVYRSEGVVSEESAGSFLEHLPSGTPVYYYNKQCAMETLSSACEDSVGDCFVVLKQFPPETFAEQEEQLPGRCDYSPSLQTLIITMPSPPHEAAASMFEQMITKVTQEMGVNRLIAPRGATLVETPGRSKQADRSWKPRRQGRNFPTVALEVGFSQTTAKLEKDIAWWINESKGEVRMGITVDIKRKSGNIEIKSWSPAFEPPLSHVYLTKGGRHVFDRGINDLPSPRLTQRILIKEGRDGSGPTIEGGPLTVPFHTLLLKEPGEGEGDFVFTADMLLNDLADCVWDAIENA
ncbi:uncharacterized protein N7473_006675 [Penicillium subrubescens]|uniref:Uncharacterized protein n=1 Tax=Penicillium subrubescens TaxID=1316194 RepID=A0A1Q5UAG6_9EURO|nr:uncharacterized protein N7473_006675 [Penicillium subrubescens]KAJ5890447.1 hypothetical protein N7473_006675 [Penicillium subrubescens]OKP09457.1 hypothetical protein PENSUB_5193 [Penicillium subrubescens]